MTEYKLTYFNSRGLAEPMRYMFAFAGVPYEDNRLPIHRGKDFPVMPPEMKALYPWGNVPVLEVNGKVLAQSLAIGRFLSRKFNLAGKDEFESAKCDEYVDAVREFALQWKEVLYTQDPVVKAQKSEIANKTITPIFMQRIEKILENNGGKWLVGSGVTWADFFLSNIITFFSAMQESDIAEGYPLIKKHSESILTLPGVKEYIETRPKVEYFRPDWEWNN